MAYISHPYLRTHQCKKCGNTFDAKTHNAKYCYKCCMSFRSPYKNLPTGTVGAISELMVAVDLMKRGYEVFRALSPHCSCDIAILKNGKLLRVEVKTGYINPDGELVNHKNKLKTDIVAYVVHRSNEIFYHPNLSSLK